jgi:PPOX class probable F420-dependent enzyme
MLDLSPEFSALVNDRLQHEEILWFTSVTPQGIPNTNPVWFYWDGEYIIVYSQPSSWRVRNIKLNPHVALHLQDPDGHGDNTVVINGRAELIPGPHAVPDAYWAKYDKYLPGLSMSRQDMLRDYSVQIRVRPQRVRGE